LTVSTLFQKVEYSHLVWTFYRDHKKHLCKWTCVRCYSAFNFL